MATKNERRRRLSKRRTRTHRTLKGVNIGQPYHRMLEWLADEAGDSADGSLRFQAEYAIEFLASVGGCPLATDRVKTVRATGATPTGT